LEELIIIYILKKGIITNMNYNIHTINIEDKEYPEILKRIKKPPQKLYAIGDISLLKSNCIAIVGTRCCSEYGYKMATKFAKELANIGITVVSGLAIRNRYSST